MLLEEEKIEAVDDETAGTAKKKKPNKVTALLDRVFRLSERGTSVKSEILAGLGMSLVMLCFFVVGINMMGQEFGISYFALYFVFTLISFVGTLAMGLVCNVPLAQTSGLTMSILFVSLASEYTGLTFENLLFINFIACVIYVVLAVTPVRSWLTELVPPAIRQAVPIALGSYIVIVALEQSGIITVETGTFFSSISLTTFSSVTSTENIGRFAGFLSVIVALIVYVFFKARNSAHPALFAFLVATIVFFLIALLSGSYSTIFALNRLWFVGSEDAYSVARGASENEWLALFTSGTDFSAFTESGGNVAVVVIRSVLLFLLLGMTENEGIAGYVMSGSESSFYDGRTAKKVHIVGSVTGVVASLVGCPMPTVSRASSMAREDGGRTGLTAVVAALVFLIGMFTWLPYIFFATWTDITVEWYYGHYGQCMSYYATAEFVVAFAVVACVGIAMIVNSIKQMDAREPSEIMLVVVTVAVSVLTCNIVTGVSVAILVYAIAELCSFNLDRIKGIGWRGILVAIALIYLIMVLI